MKLKHLLKHACCQMHRFTNLLQNCLKKYLLNLSLAGATTINTPLSEVLKLRKGVCQDFTHLMIASLRIGFAVM
jgi:hypothetical protein